MEGKIRLPVKPEIRLLKQLVEKSRNDPESYRRASILIDKYLDLQMERNDLIDKIINFVFDG